MNGLYDFLNSEQQAIQVLPGTRVLRVTRDRETLLGIPVTPDILDIHDHNDRPGTQAILDRETSLDTLGILGILAHSDQRDTRGIHDRSDQQVTQDIQVPETLPGTLDTQDIPGILGTHDQQEQVM